MSISNYETQRDNILQVIDFYNSKAKLKTLFERKAIRTDFQFKIGHSDRKRWDIKCRAM